MLHLLTIRFPPSSTLNNSTGPFEEVLITYNIIGSNIMKHTKLPWSLMDVLNIIILYILLQGCHLPVSFMLIHCCLKSTIPMCIIEIGSVGIYQFWAVPVGIGTQYVMSRICTHLMQMIYTYIENAGHSCPEKYLFSPFCTTYSDSVFKLSQMQCPLKPQQQALLSTMVDPSGLSQVVQGPSAQTLA